MCDLTSSSPSSSPSFSSSSSSSSTMGRSCVKVGVSMAVVCVLIYMTRHMYKPRYTQGDQKLNSNGHGRDSANDKTNSAIGQQQQHLYTNNTVSANERGDYDEDNAFEFPDDNNNDDEYDDEEEDDEEEEEEVEAGRIQLQTYFSTMTVSFSDVHIGAHNSLPTLPFLEACQATTQLFEKLQAGILDRVVQHIRKNIQRVRRNYDLAPDKSNTLQEMVARELARDVKSLPENQLQSTSLFAVTWLNRTFGFISRFLSYIESGDEQSVAAGKAYKETLIQYHGFALRTIFQTAFYTLSTRSAFLRAIAVNESDVDLPGFEKTATDDLMKYNSALNRRLLILEGFFDERGIGNGYID